ncbi:nuclease-related domain-containing protein [Alkalicoccobacillus murimartini]|uniref:Ribosomal protein L37AE/L43A n=1 Tax=Alkalicoccobacillus murimartini TaxID=171685 RepID=A0ABT9YHP4_9BACI|nr:nuclease-related domain-containing protein [Alkalicoccobacillus murimartini]MDQ0207031.1 ribosomal protein L37AE/L43A [Alkalicoccobacillus murimartini]
MTVKERDMPMKMQQLLALERRMNGFPRKMKEDLLLYEAGYRGEQNLDYHLTFLEDDEFILLHDLRINNKRRHYFQIDTLVVTSRFFVILEVKNMVGRFEFNDDLKQMVRRWNGEELIMQNPLNQVRRQQTQLSDWLLHHNFPLMPIEQLLVFAHPSTAIHSTEAGKHTLSKVVYAEGVVPRLEKLKTNYGKARSYLDKTNLLKIVGLLNANHSPLLSPILKTYHLKPSQLQKGVYCPSCSAPNMIRRARSGHWHCQTCPVKSKTAHVRALEDYYLLIKQTISSAELREFLGIESKMAAYNILSKLDVRRTHKNRHCYYHLTYPLRLK